MDRACDRKVVRARVAEVLEDRVAAESDSEPLLALVRPCRIADESLLSVFCPRSSERKGAWFDKSVAL
jgi:hypothetical protein